MAAATILQSFEGLLHIPGIEVVQLECSDGETYVSKKFSVLLAAVASGNQDNDAHINVSISSVTATVNYAGMTDQKVTLILFGRS